jgi:hypothetical protein
LGDPLKGNLLLFYKPLHLEAQQVSTRIEVRRHQQPAVGRCRSCETTCTWVGPLSSHGTGVYDGPQEAPRYFIVGGEY